MLHPPARFIGTYCTCLRLWAIALAAGLLIGAETHAAEPPVVSSLSRLTAAPGEQLSLTASGKGLAGGVQLWSTFGEPISADELPPAGGMPETTRTFAVAVPASTVPGIHAVRVVSPGGVGVALPFLIDDLPSVAKVPGNQSQATAQTIAIPCAVDGRVDNLSRDYYRFPVTAGQTVSFEVFGRRLGSPIDASLYLYDDRGRILAYSDDAEGLSTDPQFVHTFAKGGDYVVELRDIRYAGGEAFSYVLRIGDFPCIHSSLPLAVQRGVATRVDFAGISCDDALPATVTAPADWSDDWFPISTRRVNGTASAFTMLAVVDSEEIVDREPNNHQPQAQKISLGPAISGRFDAPGDVDQFTFSAVKGQRYLFAGYTREIGTPSDLVFRMLNSSGKSIATADDNGAAEGVLDVTFPSDGEYTLELIDLNKRGGPQYTYRVVPTPYRPGFTLAASTETLTVPAGGTTSLTITAARRDYAGPIELSIAGLPAGVSAGPVYLGPGVNSVTTTVTADPSAKPLHLTSITIEGRAEIQGSLFTSTASPVDALRARWNGVTQVSPRFRKALALAVGPAQGFSLQLEPQEIVLGQNLKATVRVVANRTAGFDAPIKLVTIPEKDGVPGNIAIELKPIEAGKSEVDLSISANDKAPHGPFSITIAGVHEKDKTSTTVLTPSLTLRLQEAFQLAATPMSTPMLARGAQLKFKVQVVRNPAYSGEVKLTCEKLPAGVSAAEVVLNADQSEAELVLSAAADAAAVNAAEALLRASSPAEAKITSTAPLPAFSVQ